VKQFGQALHDFGVFLAKVVPNLQIYVPPRPLLTGEAADADLGTYFLRAALHGAAWSLGLLAGASFLFKRRDCSGPLAGLPRTYSASRILSPRIP
jgi:Cu-processing system permease protein